MQMGTLGAGNHYAEIQVVDEIFDTAAARKMGIERTGQVCVMIHSGSRGLGHQVPLFPPIDVPLKPLSDCPRLLSDRPSLSTCWVQIAHSLV